MPSPHRRSSRSVRVPGGARQPVRLGHQPAGSSLAPHRGGALTGDEEPQAPRGPVLPPREPPDARPADAGPDAMSPAEAARSTGLPPLVPARQGPPPKTAPGSAGRAALPATRPAEAPVTGPGAVPATGPATVPATQAAAVPATRPGAVPATRQAAAPPARRPAGEPSWGTVLATTLRMWLGRRLSKTRWRVLAALLLAALVFGAGAITVAMLKSTP